MKFKKAAVHGNENKAWQIKTKDLHIRKELYKAHFKGETNWFSYDVAFGNSLHWSTPNRMNIGSEGLISLTTGHKNLTECRISFLQPMSRTLFKKQNKSFSSEKSLLKYCLSQRQIFKNKKQGDFCNPENKEFIKEWKMRKFNLLPGF